MCSASAWRGTRRPTPGRWWGRCRRRGRCGVTTHSRPSCSPITCSPRVGSSLARSARRCGDPICPIGGSVRGLRRSFGRGSHSGPPATGRRCDRRRWASGSSFPGSSTPRSRPAWSRTRIRAGWLPGSPSPSPSGSLRRGFEVPTCSPTWRTRSPMRSIECSRIMASCSDLEIGGTP